MKDPAALVQQLPSMRIGFVLVGLYYAGSLAIGAAIWYSGRVQTSTDFMPIFEQYQWSLALIMAFAWAYWLYCVYALHKLLAAVPGWQHPTTPGKAVGFHFIPGYNLFWVIKWPSQIANFVNWRTRSNTTYRWLPGILILVGIAVRFLEPGIGTGLVFGVGIYLCRNIKRALLMPGEENTSPPAVGGGSFWA